MFQTILFLIHDVKCKACYKTIQKRTTLITTTFYHIRSFLYEEGTKYHDAVDIKTCSHIEDRDKNDYTTKRTVYFSINCNNNISNQPDEKETEIKDDFT